MVFCDSFCRSGLSECQSRSSEWYLHQWVWSSHARRVLEEVHRLANLCLLCVLQKWQIIDSDSLPLPPVSLHISFSLPLSFSLTLKLSRKQTSRAPSLFLLPNSWSICPVAERRVPVPSLPVLWQHSAATDAAHQTVLSPRRLGWECGNSQTKEGGKDGRVEGID